MIRQTGEYLHKRINTQSNDKTDGRKLT